MTCRTCTHWSEIQEADDKDDESPSVFVGICHRYPPQYCGSKKNPALYAAAWDQPITFDYTQCGEYKTKEEV